METRHIDTIRLTNFKRFENLEVRELGQFNLIVGDNNVGKTSLLESLVVNPNLEASFFFLLDILFFKKFKKEIFNKDVEAFANKRNLFNRTFEIKITHTSGVEDIKNEFVISNKEKSFEIKIERSRFEKGEYKKLISFSEPESQLENIYDRSFNGQSPMLTYYYSKSPFLPFGRQFENDLLSFFSKLQEKRSVLRKYISNLKKTLLPNLSDIVISLGENGVSPSLLVYEENDDRGLPLSLYGDGTIKLANILAEITLQSGKRLMIDEIDAGIHYTRYKTFWKVILQAAKENQVQLFMTTHNEECIKYYREAIEELQFEAEAR
ncbi:MAG: AAA family ATPase, partial [Chryseotalea sp.]